MRTYAISRVRARVPVTHCIPDGTQLLVKLLHSLLFSSPQGGPLEQCWSRRGGSS